MKYNLYLFHYTNFKQMKNIKTKEINKILSKIASYIFVHISISDTSKSCEKIEELKGEFILV